MGVSANREVGSGMTRAGGVKFSVPVNVAPCPYRVEIGEGCLEEIGVLLRKLFPVVGDSLLVTNPTVAAKLAGRVESSLGEAGFRCHRLLMPDGEEWKTLATVSSLYERAAALGAERGWPVLALGGGVVGDTAGFFAATYLRGMPFVQLPTTLLAQIDASVGGKVAVDLPAGKNLVGAFYQPRLVLIDPATLSSLPARQLRSGMAEVIKTAALAGGELLELLEEQLERLLRQPGTGESWGRLIQKTVAFKARVVEADERETTGLRTILNLGHTVGHGLETLTGYRVYTHGEAVAIGLGVALRLSRHLLDLPAEEEGRIVALLRRTGLPLLPFEPWQPERDGPALAQALQRDKKVLSGEVRFVLLRRLGEPVVSPVPGELLHATLDELWGTGTGNGAAKEGVGE